MEYIFFSTLLWSILWFIASVILKRNDIADIAWGLFPIFLGFIIFIFTPVISSYFFVIYIFISIWALRLAFHIGKRTLAKKQEDPRYKQWRDTWKYFYARSFLQVFLLQSLLALILALPFIFSVSLSDLAIVNIVGVLLFCFGFCFEVVADNQLSKFIESKKSGKTKAKIITSGLWKYTRHPNYFGEVILWWGIFFMTFDLAYWYYSIASPLLITFLILKVSGIPMAEARYAGNQEWEEYKKNTPAFFPKIIL